MKIERDSAVLEKLNEAKVFVAGWGEMTDEEAERLHSKADDLLAEVYKIDRAKSSPNSKSSGVTVTVVDFKAEGAPSTGDPADGETFKKVVLEHPAGTVVNVSGGEGGGGQRGEPYIDEDNNWVVGLTTDNQLPAGQRPEFFYKLVCIR